MNTAIMVIAIIAGPILAIQIQKLIERITQKRDEKRRLFMTLMATRGRPLVLEHVQALNMIDIIFSTKSKAMSIFMSIIFWRRSKKEKAVIGAWSELRDHLYDVIKQPTSQAGTETSKEDMSIYKVQSETWVSKKNDLLIELLSKMAESLGYHFDKVLLKRGAYTPTGYGETELSQLIIRRGLTELFLGLKSIPIHIVKPPLTKAVEPSQKNVQQEKSNSNC